MLATKLPSIRLGIAVQLMVYRRTGRFALHAEALSAETIGYLAEQTETNVTDLVTMTGWVGRAVVIVPRFWIILGFFARQGRICAMLLSGPKPNSAHLGYP